MYNRKWIINLTALLFLLVTFSFLSGFYVESCASVQIEGAEIAITPVLYIADEDTDLFKGTTNEMGLTSDTCGITVYVVNGSTVSIPVTVYLKYNEAVLAENFSVFVDETAYPFIPSTYNNENALAASFTVPYTAAAGEEDKTFTIQAVYIADGSSKEIFSQLVTVKSAEQILCSACREVISYDGVITHGICSGCGVPCVDGVIAHAACSACGGTCAGEGIVHDQCEVCGAVCDGNGITHKNHPVDASSDLSTPAADESSSTSTDNGKSNVDTGANDMVSVAVAMAVVSLAAGAVASK